MTEPGAVHTTPRLVGLLGPRGAEWGRTAQAVGVGVVGQLAGIGLLATSAWLITTASLRPPVLTLMVAIAAVQAFSLGRGVARYAERLAGHDLALRVLARVRVWAYGRIEPIVPGPATGTRTGDLLARFVADVDGILDLYVRAVLPLITAVVTAAGAVALGWLLDPPAGWVLAGGLSGAVVVLPVITARLGMPGAALSAARGERDGLVVETLRGGSEIVSLGAESFMLARVAANDRRVARLGRRLAVAAGVGQAFGAGLGGALAAATVFVAIPALRQGTDSGITVAVLAFLALGAADAVSGLPDAAAHLADSVGGARRVLALTDLSGRAVPASVSAYQRHAGLSGGVVPAGVSAYQRPAGSPTLSFERVSLTWPGARRPAVDGINLQVRPGSHVAIIGPSGAGKTSLSHLLLRFVEPTSGRVSFDGIDVTQLDPEEVRSLIAWAPQDPHVFGTTLAANLRLAAPDATNRELWDALAAVGLGDWAAGLTDGLDTVLSERAATISGGEAQRLGVARALLADRPILLLDEPTAHLDEPAAVALQASVLSTARGRTLLWITHRLDGLERFDQVIMLANGHSLVADASAASLSSVIVIDSTQR